MNNIQANLASTDAEGHFLTDAEIELIFNKIQRADQAIEAAKQLTQRAEILSEGASQLVYEKFPQYALTSDQRAKCIRDASYFYVHLSTQLLNNR